MAHDYDNGGEILPESLDTLIRTVLQSQRDELFLSMDAWLAEQRRRQATLGTFAPQASTQSTPLNAAVNGYKDAPLTLLESPRSPRPAISEAIGTAANGQKEASRQISPTGDETFRAVANTREGSQVMPGSLADRGSYFPSEGAISQKRRDAARASRLSGVLPAYLARMATSYMGEEDEDDLAVIIRERTNKRKRLSRQTGAEANNKNCLLRMIYSPLFEVFFAFVVITQSVALGVQVEYEATNRGEAARTEFALLNFFYTLAYVVELLLRMYKDSLLAFLCKSQDLYWNYLDLIIVISSLFEVSIEVQNFNTSGSSQKLSVIRSLRIIRIARVARVIKVVRFVQPLRALCSSISSALKPLAYSLFLLFLLIYVCGIIFTDSVTGYIQELELLGGLQEAADTVDVLVLRFGNLHQSMHTLFRSISNGLDWSMAAEALQKVHWVYTYCFTVFVTFSCFAVLNVMTGVFCQNASEASQRDHDLVAQAMVADREYNLDIMRQLFSTIGGHDQMINLQELEAKFEDEKVTVFLKSLDLAPTDAWTLFKLLDVERRGEVDLDDFIDGCSKLKGSARALDLACIQGDTRLLKKTVNKMEKVMANMEHKLESLMAYSISALKARSNQHHSSHNFSNAGSAPGTGEGSGEGNGEFGVRV